MGARVIRKPDPSARKRKETLTLWAIIAAIGFPLFLAYILVAVDMRSDLSELNAAKHVDDRAPVPVGWPELEADGAQGRIRMIGYMMDGYQPSSDGTPVDMFILLPEAGQFLHPAHRIPNQMVEVRPRHAVPFRRRELVWAVGTLNQNQERKRRPGQWAMQRWRQPGSGISPNGFGLETYQLNNCRTVCAWRLLTINS